MVNPLDAYIGFGQLSFISEDKAWAALSLNKTGRDEGKYDFKGESFEMSVKAMAGHIINDEHWLIAVLGEGSCNKGGVFEFKVWKQGTDGNKGSFDKAAGEAQALQWQKDGCHAAIEVSGIPVLKAFVRALAETKYIVREPGEKITVRCNIPDAEIPTLENAFKVYWDYLLEHEGNDPEEGHAAYDAGCLIAEAGLPTYPCATSDDLPSVELRNKLGKVSGKTTKCFSFTGELPKYDALTVVLPKKEEKKTSGNRSYGNAVVDPKAVINARFERYIAEWQIHFPDVKNVYDTSCEIMGDDTGLLKAYSDLLLKVIGE
ncbi:hypothetical protein [Nostoc sp.]|uniref:hypothetical protein n=1 Tax=Nostoc sp. TaxID=1180 RepID=UPI002FFCF831